MAKLNPDSPEAFSALVRQTLLKGFAIPLGVLLFFACATPWLNSKLQSQVADEIARDGTLTPAQRTEQADAWSHVNFAQVVRSSDPEWAKLRGGLEQAGVTGQFARLRWGLWLSILLVAILVGVTVSTFVLNRRARTSPGQLIPAYRTAWRLSIAAAMTKVVLLIPLLTYGCFELTTLETGSYWPKLIILIVIGGVVALVQGGKALLKAVPMEFDMRLTRAVTEQDAPVLWQDVRAAAARLGTAAPDHILVGMSHNFYVTELAVKYAGGRAEGRTLYLSHPLMQQLAPDEVMAIIGHELGHFRGEDTKMTREFYPMRFKVGATLNALAQSGWVGWTSLHSLLFFHWSFATTEQAVSRERELLADRAAAELTTAAIMGRALVKVHAFGEAFNRALLKSGNNPYALSLAAIVRDDLAPQPEFWSRLFEQKAPHPLDSHPALRVRLEALAQPVDAATAAVVATTETPGAYERWFAGRDELFTDLTGQVVEQVKLIRTQTADYATEEGKVLLESAFPAVHWPGRPLAIWLRIGPCVLAVLLAVSLLIAVDGWGVKVPMLVLAALCASPIPMIWRRHRGGEFVLRADSISYTGWTRPLRFEEIALMRIEDSFGSLTLRLHMKANTKGLWKFSPFFWMPTRLISLPLGLMAGKQKEKMETIFRYFTRQA